MSWTFQLRLRVGDLELDLEAGGGNRPVAIVGPNGAGKTTLLRTIAGAHRPHRGRIVVADRTLFDAERGVDLPPEARRIGYVPQGYGLFPHLSVLANVAFGLSPSRRPAAVASLEAFGCGHLAERTPSTLSGGEKQKAALARALVRDPELLLLDEPLAALDATARRALRRTLADQIRQRNKPALVVTHDLRDAAALDAELLVLEAGRITQRGTIEALRADPATDFVRELF